MIDWVRTVFHTALDKKNVLNFWISVQVRYPHPARDVKRYAASVRPQGQEAADELWVVGGKDAAHGADHPPS